MKRLLLCAFLFLIACSKTAPLIEHEQANLNPINNEPIENEIIKDEIIEDELIEEELISPVETSIIIPDSVLDQSKIAKDNIIKRYKIKKTIKQVRAPNLSLLEIPYAKISKPKWVSNNWQPKWNAYIEKALNKFGQHLLYDQHVFRKKDLNALECTGFETANPNQRKAFFSLLFASIVYKESGFNPKTRYWEKTMDKYSEGLLQLSVDDRTRHKYCPLTPENILDPKTNLTCGLSIMIDQLKRRYEDGENGVLFPRRSYYWLVLTAKTKQEVQRFFKKYAKRYFNFC